MQPFRILAAFLALLLSIESTLSAKILCILPIPFVEHQLVYQPLIENLHKHEHEITVMTTSPGGFREPEGRMLVNITEIDLSFVNHLDILDELTNDDLDGSDMIKTVFNVMRKIYEAELKSPKVTELLQSKETYFDLVIVDWSGSSSVMNVFAHHFDAPLVAITHGEAFPNVHEAFGNLNHPVIYPSVFLPFTENLNLFQRVSSVLSTIWYRFYYYNEEIPLQNEIIKNVMYPNSDISPDMWEIETNADLLLINSYEILNNIRPTVPTTVYLGGIHQKLHRSPMSSSLAQFLDESRSIVYVNLNNAIQEPSRLQKLLSAMENAQLDIVWNSRAADVNSTARIFHCSDVDQENVLAHPNTVLHIFDGGQRSTEDSIHHAVPAMGISYSSSLEHYLHQIEKFDCGLISYIDHDSWRDVESKIDELLSSPRYKTNMIRLKSLILDQPIGNSVERATWWINYVIRNSGTKHLRNEYKSLGWFKYLMLDVLLTVTVGFVSALAAVVYIIIRIRRYSQSLPFEKVTRKAKLKSL